MMKAMQADGVDWNEDYRGAAVAAFHRRPLKDIYPVLMLDGVVLSRKTGAGALKRPDA